MKRIKNILSKILYGFIFIIVLYATYNFISIKILHRDLVSIFGYATLEVVSGSMEPTIMTGDLIIINTYDKEYHEGDIVTFYDVNDSFVTHRILSFEEDNKMITKGDNNNTIDAPTETRKIVGKYVTRLNNVGRIMASFKSPITLTLIFIIGILTCVFISMDKDGNPKLTQEEKEYEEFLQHKKEQEEKENNKKKTTTKKKSTTSKKITTKKSSEKKTTNKKVVTKKATPKKSAAKKSTQSKKKSTTKTNTKKK